MIYLMEYKNENILLDDVKKCCKLISKLKAMRQIKLRNHSSIYQGEIG